MSYNKTIPTPPTASQELADKLKANYLKLYKGVFNTELLVTSSKQCYSIIINTTDSNNLKLENYLGSANAKVLVAEIMQLLLTGKSLPAIQ